MKNITLSADERLIELARDEAKIRKTTLNALFREWLAEIGNKEERRQKADKAMNDLAAHLSFDRKFTRDEMNER